MQQKDEAKVAQAIEELRSLAFQYAKEDDEVNKLQVQLSEASFKRAQLGGKLADAHYKHRTLLGRLSNNLTLQTGPIVYHFEIDQTGVTKFISDTAL